MKMRHSNTRLSIYGMGDTPAFVINGDAPTFVIKGDTPLATCISFTCIIGDTQ
jgi:hypothetical protein